MLQITILLEYSIHHYETVLSPVAQTVKNLPAMQETWIQSLDREDHLRKAWQLTQVFLHGESHGQRNLAGYNPGGRKELDTTQRHTHTMK